MARYMLYTKNETWAKIVLFAAKHEISMGKFLNILLDNIAETLSPSSDFFGNPTVFSKPALLQLLEEIQQQTQTEPEIQQEW